MFHSVIGQDALNVRGCGALDIRFRPLSDGHGPIDRAYQSGCLRMRLPRVKDGAFSNAVLLNTAGGLCDGDRLDQKLAWADGASALVTTQAAEKVYRATDQGARISTSIEVGDGARAEWLPQETILFDHARLCRQTDVRLSSNSNFLGCEAVVLGRTAMGERVEEGLLEDRWRIWREGRLIYADAQRLAGPIDANMARAPVGGGARAMALVIHASQAAGTLLAPARAAAESVHGLMAVSSWGPLLVVRLLAQDGAVLRHDLGVALRALRGGRPNPRIWGC